MLDVIKTILQSDAAVSAATNYIGIETIPQGINMPYIVLSIIDGEANTTKDSLSKMDEGFITIDTYSDKLYTGDGMVGAYILQQLIEAVLDGQEATVEGTTIYTERRGIIQTYQKGTPTPYVMNTECDYRAYLTKT